MRLILLPHKNYLVTVMGSNKHFLYRIRRCGSHFHPRPTGHSGGPVRSRAKRLGWRRGRVWEFAKVYPNPAKELLNLAYYTSSTGTIGFELMDELGEPVMQQTLDGSGTFAQFGTGNLSSGLYYWVLKDGERMIKNGKVAIMR